MKRSALRNIFFYVIVGAHILACNGIVNQDKKPNVLFLIADDLGYADLSCYGGTSNTDHLDELASEGIRLTNFYAAAPNCSPSRAGLMTGIHPALLGMYSYRAVGHTMHLPASEITIAEVMQEAGYQTAHFGKWHLSNLPKDSILDQPGPLDQGFDYSFGTENNAQPSHLNPTNFVRNGKLLPMQEGYSSHILADDFSNWLSREHLSDRPFFAYVAFHEPHAKIASPPELVDKYSSFPKKDAEYLANIHNLDLAIGKIMDNLKGLELYENTIIFFASDNGSYRAASNGSLRAIKSYVYEGGIRVPGIFKLSGGTSGAKVIHEAAGFLDMLPTVCDWAEIKLEKHVRLGGQSIAGLLTGNEMIRQQPLWWFFYRTSPEMAMRIGDINVLGQSADTVKMSHRFSTLDMDYIKEMSFYSYEIYDLSNDVSQSKVLSWELDSMVWYTNQLDIKLKLLQEIGPYWSGLPTPSGIKRLKKEWNPYQ